MRDTRRRTIHGIRMTVLVCLLCFACSEPARDTSAAPDDVPFVERAAELGLDFVHVNGMTGEYYFPEIVGPGGAMLDYDNDGDLDLYLVQGTALPPAEGTAAAIGDRLFRNELVESGRLRFVDVTEASGIRSNGYGMGVATGDFDDDGHVDLYVTNFGANVLLKNNGDGSFDDVTASSGTGDPRWSTSAAFVDYDGDGRLDLFVADYVDFSLANHKPCYAASSARDYCGPLSYEPVHDRLYRNLGGGRFEDVTIASHIALGSAAGLGVIVADLNLDGRSDLYVANDAHPNQLWINQGDGTFAERALISGCALNAEGRPEGSMGIDAADFDGDGDDDLFMTHLVGETNTLYVNDGTGRFADRTLQTGLGATSVPSTGFGTAFLDYDNDGLLDLIAVNGAVKTIAALAQRGDPFPLHEPNQIFRNIGQGRFEDVSSRAGAAFELSEVSRGAAFGDVDNDGDVDVLVLNNNGPARLLINQVGNRRGWLGLRLVDATTGSDVPGARAEVRLSDGRTLWRRSRPDGSYASANDPRILTGLGDASVEIVRIHWPDGTTETWPDLSPATYTTLRKGDRSR